MRMREVSGSDPQDPNDDYKIKYDFDFDTENPMSASVNIFISTDSYVGLYIKDALGFQSKVLSARAIISILKIISDGDVFYKRPIINWKYLFKPKLFINKSICDFLVESGFPYADIFRVVEADCRLNNTRKYEPWS
ncbi:hypothetical protein [Methylicorpusculum sp.]|uniref:hypothetical protein n=1 Tax=Methylicorpusculum sp. TaxID=2713644 RepID=UPI002AC8ACBA|nr:hypothetical protein [Methylicorpusculum sp.]